MKIKTIVEQENGNYEFQAELTPEQHAFLIEFAIKELVRAGLIPFANAQSQAERASIVVPEPNMEQLH